MDDFILTADTVSLKATLQFLACFLFGVGIGMMIARRWMSHRIHKAVDRLDNLINSQNPCEITAELTERNDD